MMFLVSVLKLWCVSPPQITIIFKPYQECTDQKVYQAVTDDLPAAFVDGSVSGGEGDTRSLWVVEQGAGHHVEIHAGYMGVTVIVRQQGRYLTLAVRMPEELAKAYDETQDLQLCVNGCPTGERIDQDGLLPLPLPALGLQHQQNHPPRAPPSQVTPRGAFTPQTAMAKCQEQLQVKDLYFHSCVFDLLTTGDVNFTSAAYHALKDMETLHPKRERWHIFPRANSGPSPAPFLHHLLLLTLITAMLL